MGFEQFLKKKASFDLTGQSGWTKKVVGGMPTKFEIYTMYKFGPKSTSNDCKTGCNAGFKKVVEEYWKKNQNNCSVRNQKNLKKVHDMYVTVESVSYKLNPPENMEPYPFNRGRHCTCTANMKAEEFTEMSAKNVLSIPSILDSQESNAIYEVNEDDRNFIRDRSGEVEMIDKKSLGSSQQ